MLAGAAQQSRPFSHALHLKLKPDCVSCHAAAPASSNASDNNLPAPAVCAECHSKPIPVKAPAKTLVTHFSHAVHLKMGNLAPVIAAAVDAKTYLSPLSAAVIRPHLGGGNACEACHRGLRESAAVTRDALPQMADCLTCHNKIDNPFSCEQCHDAGPHLKPASIHVTRFIDLHSSAKANLDKQSCTICHGRKFTCLGCH